MLQRDGGELSCHRAAFIFQDGTGRAELEASEMADNRRSRTHWAADTSFDGAGLIEGSSRHDRRKFLEDLGMVLGQVPLDGAIGR
jgi:hypothetical protein